MTCGKNDEYLTCLNKYYNLYETQYVLFIFAYFHRLTLTLIGHFLRVVEGSTGIFVLKHCNV